MAAVALGMGLIGLVAGLLVVYYRGGPAPEPDPGPAATVTPPTDLYGLRLLPRDCNLVFALQPGPVLAYAARTNQDPRDLLTKAGAAPLLGALDRSGVTLQQVDHVAAGAYVPDTDLGQLRFALVLALRRPLPDEDGFLHRLGAKPAVRGGKALHEVKFGDWPLVLARHSATVWVFGWSDRDLDPATRGGDAAGPDPLSPGLREVLAEKLPPDAAAWVAADAARWAEKKPVELLLGFAGGKKDWLAVLKRGQGAAAGLSLGDPPRLRVFVRAADAEAGEQVRAYFRAKATDPAVRSGGAGEWAMFDAPADPAAAAGLLKTFLDDAAR